MNHFKKRSLALILASVVTVAGSFAAEKYKNSLMALNFENAENGSIAMVVETKTAYNGNIAPIKRDANTYILMLPEVNSLAATPDLKNSPGNIESVNIRTMPYSSNGKGYTRITVKTMSPIVLSGKNKIFLPTQTNQTQAIEDVSKKNINEENNYKPVEIDEFSSLRNNSSNTIKQEITPKTDSTAKKNITEPIESETVVEESYFTPEEPMKKSSSNETVMLILGLLLVIVSSAYFYIKAKNKLAEIAGETLEIDVSDDKPIEKKDKKLKKIKDTVKTLDSTYAKTAVRSSYQIKPTPEIPQKAIEELNIVDLDELFKEQKNSQAEEENQALEEFLNGFSFYEEEEFYEKEPFDEEFYQETLNNSQLHFSKDDISCINKLLATEIQDETLKNIEKYLISNPIKKNLSKEKILENLITDFSISQNIIFREDDIKVLNKLISVELDPDFITDLRTNPIRTKEMSEEIVSAKEKTYKSAEIKTLNVKDMLPNLSEELQRHGKKEIESNHKPETIYFQKGFDVSIMSVTGQLPDLSKEIDKEEAYISKPSAEIELLDSSYQVATLSVSESLTDISTLLKNDSEQKESKKIVDETTLIKNLENVQFKPVYNSVEKEYIDLDVNKKTKIQNIQEEEKKEKKSASEEITKKIAETKTEQKLSNKPVKKIISQKSHQEKPIIKTDKKIEKCIVENESYIILSSVNFTENLGCHLAKNNNGYTVLAYTGDKVSKIKSYKELKSEKIQARLSEKLTDNTLRFIVRIGLYKFVVDVKDSTVNYVMDLC